jgi:rhodanese-related sulfurtransferase
MVGREGDQTKEEVRWNLVNLVRSLAKNGRDRRTASGFQRQDIHTGIGAQLRSEALFFEFGLCYVTCTREDRMAHAPKFLAIVNDAKKRVKETNVPDVKRRMDGGEKFVVIDVREESEWARGHLPGAIHLGKGVIERDIEQRVPDTSTKLVLYCGGGFRSALAADNLQKMGYSNVESMDGGWKGWLDSGYPTQKD